MHEEDACYYFQVNGDDQWLLEYGPVKYSIWKMHWEKAQTQDGFTPFYGIVAGASGWYIDRNVKLFSIKAV